MSGGQTLNDRLTAAKHAIAGQGLARIVCKATTEELIGPKKKHLDHLLHCTNEPNVSVPQMANLLLERTQHSSWVVVFKALITMHHLMCYGNDRFMQYLASSNCTVQVGGNFVDKLGISTFDISGVIRRYSKYLNEKSIAYRTVAFDFCKCKRGKEDGVLRTMTVDKLLKTLPVLQNQLDALLDFDCSSVDIGNGVVNASFMLLFRDLIRLFACYNDGIINLLEKYFDMNKKHCRDALDIYKKFLIRMDRVAEFLKVAENVGIDKGEIPDLTKLKETCSAVPRLETNKAPSSLLEALEQHLATLEGRKGSASAAAATAATRAMNLKNAVWALSHTSNAFGSAGETAPAPQEVNGVKVDESARKAVEEEAEVMNQLKFGNDSPLLWEQPPWEDSERRMKEVASGDLISPPSGSSKTNPFLSSPAEPAVSQAGILNIFSDTTSPSGGVNGSAKTGDLFSLNNNPFADSLFGTEDVQAPPQNDQAAFPSFTMNGFDNNSSAFATDASFAAAFGESMTPANEVATPVPASPAATAPEKSTVKLNLPVLEPFGGRSTSPSPTTDLMRGAGTTPILANPPDGGFSDTVEGAEEPTPSSNVKETSDFIWGNEESTVSETQAAATHDPFGTPFEPPSSLSQPPTAVVPPLPVQTSAADNTKTDLFGLDSSDFGDFGEQPTSAQPCAPPPSPFGGLDLASLGSPSPDLRTQAIANAGGLPPAAMMGQQKLPPSSGIDNLNFALQKAMQGPNIGAGGIVSPTFSPTPPVTGIVNPAFAGHSFPPMNACLPPGSTPPGSVSLTPLDNFGGGMAGTPSVRASSTPGYGTPPSGLSSPAKSVGSAGTFPSGGFDAFGDTLQPQTPSSKGAPSNEKPSSSLLKGDLDSTLANLASNLDINGPKQSLKKQASHQWGSPKPAAKTGPTTGWAGPPAGVAPVAGVGMGWSASPQHGFQAPVGAVPGQWGAPGAFPQQPYMVGGIRPGVPPVPMTGMQMPVNIPMAAAPAGVGMAGQPVVPPQQMYSGFAPQMTVPPTSTGLPTQAASVNDPFGAL